MRIKTNKLDYRPGEKVAITASELEEGSVLQFQVLNYGADSLKGTADDFFYKSWLAGDGMRNDSDAAAGVLGTSWLVPGTALDSILEVQARAAGGDGMFGTGDDVLASAVFADAKPGGTGSTTSVRLDQWADGPVSEGDADSTGNNNEVFVNGNLNAQKAHYNEGDAIPYRAVLDDLATGVVYGLVIQWDTVDSGAYALDYLTGYNFSFDGTKHPGEPDVTPTTGVGDVSSGATTAATIPSDSQLLDGFGAQFGVTDGLSSGQPSGQQAVTLFGAVSNSSVGPVTYNADLTKASVTIFFTYTGSAANNADAVVVAWGGHIASSLDWVDDAGETVETASDISGSPYHMRVLSLIENGTPKSIGNQDRSLSADAVLPPIPPDAGTVTVTVDDDDTPGGVGDTTSPGDAEAAVSSTTLPVTDATSVDFASLQGDAVLDTSSTAVKSGGVALVYFWDGASFTLYGSTDITDATTAAASAVFSVVLDNSAPGVFDYLFTQLGPVDQADDGNNDENDLNIDLVYTATGLGGSDDGTISVTLDDDIPVRAANPAAVTATVEEDGMSSAVAPEAGGLNGNDQSAGNRAAAGDGVGQDEATGAAGSLAALVDVGADQPGVFSLSDVTGSLPTLFSKGDAVSYAVTDSDDADTVKDTLTATAGGRTVFTLKVNPNGSWSFDLDDQLDHVDDAGNAENLLLRTSLDGSTSVAAIDFSSIVEVTDFDGDTVTPLLAGDFSVAVEDDIPVRAASPTPVTATVEEDGMSSAVAPEAGGLNGNDQSAGNRAAAGDGVGQDEATGAAGSLATLISVGADEPPAFSLSDVTSSLPSLFSKGDAVSYAVTDSDDADTVKDTLTATAGGRTVFTLKVNPNGSWSFDLDDQLDHVDDAGNAENLLLRTALDGSTSVAAIDFSSIVEVTDFDGDTVTPLLAGDFSVAVEDDIPVRAASPTPVTATVEEDGMSSAVAPEAGGLNGNDQSEGNRAAAGDGVGQDEATGAAGSLATLISVGADEPPAFSLNDVTGSLPSLFSKGDAVSYAVTDSDDADTVKDTLTATAGGRTVFTLKVNPNGSWSFDLDDQLDHVDDNLNTENLALRTAGSPVNSIDFSSIVEVTDFDGDTVTPLLAGDFSVAVEDDIPVRAASPTPVTATVEEDGMSSAVAPEAGGLNGNDQSEGNRAAAGDGVGQDEATGAAGSLATLISVGADEPPAFSLSDVTSSLPTLYSKGDAVSYAVTDSADADTIKDTLTATAGGRTVFTLKVNPNGSWAFDLDDQLDHVDNNLNTENLLLRTALDGSTSVAAIDFSSIVEVTDFDGDTVRPLVAGDFSMAVEDDIPVVTSITNVVGFNTGAPLTGLYNAPIGSDEPGSAGTDDGVVLQTLAGVAPSGRAIFNVSLTHDSATTSSFEFDYFTSPAPSNASLHATGTVTFNSDGTYVVDLDGPLMGGTTFSTSGGISHNYDTIGNNSPEITVKEYSSSFFGVLTGQAASPPSDTEDLQTDDSDLTFANGDTLKSAATSYVNVSTDTVGVDSDTVQAGELLTYDFFTENPVSGPTSPPAQAEAVVDTSTPMAFVDAVDITLNQINLGHEDVAILLKLYNGSSFTTRLLLANSTSDYQAIAGESDVLVSVTPDDYPAGYQIYGIQVMTSTESLQGTGFALSDGAAVTLGTTGKDLADSSDGDVMKIIKIEVHIDQPGDADLQFTGKVVDADGDEASGLNFNVHLEGASKVLSGSAGADQFVLAAGDTGITLATAATIDGFDSASDSIATSKVAADATIADGGALADFAAFVTAANAVLTDGAGTDAIYVAYNAAGSGNAWAVVDENNSGSVDTGDTLVVLTGVNTAGEIVAADFT
ncbi:hypothetical protein [Ramlibacter sp. WS9]|uniref:hypothetical protein n=1 Tax=Ramlibacter sp. WS9 TaxID=1882741 RepID=UPI0011420D06|nr:hypothetical protein [Ramlibacter sp. WS9]ROZ77740.1 hypothetical protein EEB15_09920 [Ramlibacter sp. WS9]